MNNNIEKILAIVLFAGGISLALAFSPKSNLNHQIMQLAPGMPAPPVINYLLYGTIFVMIIIGFYLLTKKFYHK